MNTPSSDPAEVPESTLQDRRRFLQSLGKWSGAAIAAGCWLTSVPRAQAGAWANSRIGGGAWANARPGGGGAWSNRAVGGGAWANSRVGGGGGAWANRAIGGGAWVNRF